MTKLQSALKPVYDSLILRLHQWRLQQQPQNPWRHDELAQVLVKQQQWQAAIASCQQAIQLDASCPWFYKTLAEAYIGKGQWAEAVSTCQTALEQLDLDKYLSEQILEYQAEHPSERLSDLGSASWLYHTLGKAYMGAENWPAAIESCQRAIALDSHVSWFHYHLGEALVKSGNWQQAIPVLQQAIQLDPNFAWSYYYLGEALLAEEKTEAAIAIYQQVTQKHPEIAYLQHCLAYAQHLQNQEQRIAAYCRQAQQAPPHRQRLKILMLTPYPTYPPKLGAITRMFHEMQALGQQHELVVVSFIFSKQDYRLEADLATYCELGLTVMIGDAPPRQPQQPKLIHRYSSQRMRKLLSLLQSAQFDLVLCEFIYMSQYIELFPDAYHVLGEHNIESCLLKRCAAVQATVPNQSQANLGELAQQREAVKAFVAADSEADLLTAFENAYWPKFQLRLVVSQLDQQEMDRRCSVGQSLVVSNGIDTQQIQLLPLSQTPSQSRTLLFIGTMSYYPNIDGVGYFVSEILPLIWQHCPEVTFCIAGAEPPQAILDLAQPRISVIANPDDMSQVAETCALTVVPLRIGSGTRIKILHSMAMGLPVVSTSLGCEGLAVTDAKHLLIRDQPHSFATAVCQLLANPNQQQYLRQNARQLVEQQYDWQQIFTTATAQITAAFQSSAPQPPTSGRLPNQLPPNPRSGRLQ